MEDEFDGAKPSAALLGSSSAVGGQPVAVSLDALATRRAADGVLVGPSDVAPQPVKPPNPDSRLVCAGTAAQPLVLDHSGMHAAARIVGPPEKQRQGWLLPVGVLIGVAVVLLLAVGAAMSLTRDSHPGHNRGVEVSAEWDPVLAPYVGFVSEARGLSFVHPVNVEFLDIEESLSESAALSLSDFDPATVAYYEGWGRVTAILGLTEPGQDPFASQSEVRSEGAAAYYDLAQEVIVLPNGKAGIDLQLSIVHELTHALQHQNGLLEGEPLTADQAVMGLALAEGDATRVENQWYEMLSDADKDVLSDEVQELQAAGEAPSGYYAVSFGAPYILGESAISILVADGDYERLNDEQAAARLSTELLIDPFTTTPFPNSALSLGSGQAVPAKATYELNGSLGPLMLYQTLAPSLGAQSAVEALKGYDGDGFDLWSESTRRCLDLEIVFDKGSEAKQFADLTSSVLGAPVTVAGISSSSRALHYQICEGASIGSPLDQNFELIYPLALNNYLSAVLNSAGRSSDVAACGAASIAFGTDVSLEDELDFDDLVDRALNAADSAGCD